MQAADLVKAIKFLRPSAEFSFTEADYSTIKWDVLEGDAPTLAELEAANLEIQEITTAEVEAKAQAKASAEAKLAALGLTTDDLKALGL
jgi:hypothetical protein